MERKKASDFPQELLDLLDEYVHGDIEPPRVSRRRAEVCRRRRHRHRRCWESLRPNYAWAQQVAKTTRASRPRPHRPVAARATAASRASSPGRPRPRQAAGRPRHPREPRPQSLHRGRRPPPGGRRLHRLRAGRPDLGRRLPRRRGEGARSCSATVDGAQDAQGLRRRGEVAQEPAGLAPASSAPSASASAAASSTRWPCGWAPTSPPACRSTAASRTRPTPPRSRRRCCCTTAGSTRASTPAGRPTKRPSRPTRSCTRPTSTEGQPRLPQRHDAALRRGGRQARLGPDAGLVQQVSARGRLTPQATTRPPLTAAHKEAGALAPTSAPVFCRSTGKGGAAQLACIWARTRARKRVAVGDAARRQGDQVPRRLGRARVARLGNVREPHRCRDKARGVAARGHARR